MPGSRAGTRTGTARWPGDIEGKGKKSKRKQISKARHFPKHTIRRRPHPKVARETLSV